MSFINFLSEILNIIFSFPVHCKTIFLLMNKIFFDKRSNIFTSFHGTCIACYIYDNGAGMSFVSIFAKIFVIPVNVISNIQISV